MSSLSWLWLLWLVTTAGDGGDDCAGCHVAEATTHAQSRHAIAWTNDLFRGEYDPHPKTWCVSCHAPDVPTALQATPSAVDPVASKGVSCRSCHVREGRVRGREVSGRAPHASVVDPSLGTAEDCGTCHQFNFPRLDDRGSVMSMTTEPMQNTVAQHRQSGSELECYACHALDHSMPGSHSAPMLARALETHACRLDEHRFRITLRNRGATHHVPSGGVHRHIAVETWRSAAPAQLHRTQLGRWFSDHPGGGKRTIVDTTIASGGTRVVVIDSRSLGGSTREPIHIALRYVYASPDAASAEAGRAPARTFFEETVALAALPRCEAGR